MYSVGAATASVAMSVIGAGNCMLVLWLLALCLRIGDTKLDVLGDFDMTYRKKREDELIKTVICAPYASKACMH